MNQSTPEKPKPSDPLSILLLGPPGQGKTTLSMEFPSVCILSCDGNLDGPERFLRTKKKDLSYGYENIFNDNDGKPLDVTKRYDRLIDKVAECKADSTVKTIVVDPLTSVNEFVIQRILAGKRSEMEARDWIPFKSTILSLITKLRGTGKTTICTCHESKLTEPDPKNILNRIVVGYEPSVQGSIIDYFGGFFTDVWRCTSEPAPGDTIEFKLNVVRTSKSDLKNSLGLPTAGFRIKQGESMFAKLEPFLNGKV